MSFLGKLRRLNPLRHIDQRLNEETAEKATIAVRSGLEQVDQDLPILTALLSGEPVTVTVQLHTPAEKE